METFEKVKAFYLKHLPGARMDKAYITAPCPFCTPGTGDKPGVLAVQMHPESLFAGYFRCLNRCRPGGFALHFSRLMGIDAAEAPGFDADREPYVRDMVCPVKNL